MLLHFTVGVERQPVLGLAAGKSFDLSADGLLSLEVKGSAEARPSRNPPARRGLFVSAAALARPSS